MTDIQQERLVVAPGGPRAASTVSSVRPGQTITVGNDGGATTVSAPEQAGAAVALVITPGGPRPADRVHLVESGATLDHANRELQLKTGAGEVLLSIPDTTALAPRVTPALGTGWITYSGWLNQTGSPITSFTTTWTVPRAPRTNSGQVIFLFNGIEPSDYSHILQPVLQWGPSAAGGGAYWSIASWYVGSDHAFHTNLVRVNEGEVLVGVMTRTGQQGSSFGYASEFFGIANTRLAVANNPELTWASETLEAYGVHAGTDYPATDTTPMTAINLRTGAGVPALSWSVTNRVTDVGQKTVIAVDGATAGEVDLWYRAEAGWAVNDLTAAAGAPAAAGDPAGYTWSVDTTEHVVYRGVDAHVHELWFNGGWHHNDLTVAASAPAAWSDPTGYTWSVDSTEHVVFVGGDLHVHELWFNGGWHHNDLTVAAGGPAATGSPAGYTWDVDGTEHVTYRGVDGHIHELWFNGSWHQNDLTVAAGAPIAAGDPTGYTWAVDRTEHNVYRGVDGHIHELWFNGSWHHNDLTNAAGGPPLAGSDPVGYTWDVDSTQHVVYRGGDGRLHELWFNGVWNYNDLTSASGNPGLALGKPAAYTWSADRTEHVVFRRTDSHIVELYL